MELVALIAVVVAIIVFAAGFFLGRRANREGSPASFTADSELASELGARGRATIAARIEKRKARIMERAKAQGRITNDDVEDIFCISDSTARNYLNELEAEGKLTQVGKTGSGVHYTPR